MGTASAPANATPRSHTVLSTRVEPRMETISPFFTPSAARPHPASSPSWASCVQLTSCQTPFTLRRAAVRWPSCATRCWKSCATEVTLTRSPRIFANALRRLSAVAMMCSFKKSVAANPPCGRARLVRRDPPLRHVPEALVLGRIVAGPGVQHLLDELLRLVALAVLGKRVGEVDLPPQVRGMGLHHFGEHLDGLAHVALRPGQLVEVAAPDNLWSAVEVILVDAHGRHHSVAELALEALRERSQDADALGVEAHADARV